MPGLTADESSSDMEPGGEIDLSLLTALADASAEEGHASGARDLYAALLQVRQQASGPEHPETLSAQYKLAHWTGEAGNAASASAQMAALGALWSRFTAPTMGTHSPSKPSRPTGPGRRENNAAARDLYTALLPAMFGVLGRRPPYVLGIRAEFASFTAASGDVSGALKQFSVLVPETERALGAERPDTLAARHLLAAMTAAAGDKAEARQQLAALLALAKHALGPRHPITHAVRGNLLPIGTRTRRVTGTSAGSSPGASRSGGLTRTMRCARTWSSSSGSATASNTGTLARM